MSGLAPLLKLGLKKAANQASKLPEPSMSQKTQRSNTTATYEKVSNILGKESDKEKVLDFGAGLGLGAKKLGKDTDTYEPFPTKDFKPTYTDSTTIPSSSYDKVSNLNVLNVVDRETRDSIVKEIGRVLKPNGKAIISTRGRDVLDAKGTPGPEDMSIITSTGTYQKGFTQKELREYVQSVLGEGYIVKSVKNVGKAAVEITKKGKIEKNKGGRVERNPYGNYKPRNI